MSPPMGAARAGIAGARRVSEIPDNGLEHQYDVLSQSGVDPLVDQQGSNDLVAAGSPTRQSGDINGNDSINVDGVDDLYQGSVASVGSSGEWTVAWVGRYLDTGDAFDYGFVNGDVGSAGYGFTANGNNSEWAIVQAGSDVRGGTTDTNLHKWILTYDGTNALLEIDGTVIIDAPISAPNPSGSLSIGGDYVDLTFDALDFGEFAWYSESKDSSGRQAIRDYFDRWGF